MDPEGQDLVSEVEGRSHSPSRHKRVDAGATGLPVTLGC